MLPTVLKTVSHMDSFLILFDRSKPLQIWDKKGTVYPF